MAEIPTADQFYKLSLVADRYEELGSKAIDFELDALAVDGYRDADVPAVATTCAKLLKEKHDEALGDDCKATIEWIEAEPAFAMAFKSLGYIKVGDDHWHGPIQRELERWVPRLRDEKNSSSRYLSTTIARIPNHYLKYISRLAGACHRYISGIGHRAVIEGPSTIRRLKDLIAEFEEVLSTEWLPDSLRTNLAYSFRTKSALETLEHHVDIASPTSRRNDADLPTRLFATDLLRINQDMFRSFHKKSVFHLMGLSFVERPLEMRTIERLAKNEVDAHREIAAKRISDKRGLDYDYVLATLKANKSFTFPRENTG